MLLEKSNRISGLQHTSNDVIKQKIKAENDSIDRVEQKKLT